MDNQKKEDIIKEALSDGIREAGRRHGVPPSTLSRWVKKWKCSNQAEQEDIVMVDLENEDDKKNESSKENDKENITPKDNNKKNEEEMNEKMDILKLQKEVEGFIEANRKFREKIGIPLKGNTLLLQKETEQ